MIDLRARFGDERQLVGYDELMRVMAADKTTVEPGDMVCLHTGFARAHPFHGPQARSGFLHGACAVLNGRDQRLLDWISSERSGSLDCRQLCGRSLSLLPGAEPCCSILPLPSICLFKNGIPLGELWRLTPLANSAARARRSRFLLTGTAAAPARSGRLASDPDRDRVRANSPSAQSARPLERGRSRILSMATLAETVTVSA